ncbi:HPF/RaiA family ribosome-associated protein [Oscillatoria sp. FACHB-1407]|uniref:HPF/RaiA family ribosome-associated protein n=1 Tax=Oscillatoria sp. FACHB-1407 TaxID=2692847 RepID=UPI001681D234|nr:HPF/RaiA family ribosome-associated protein [Oscillatoria sp. FACHB-1407]MBD2459866.1 HPF/RaiA family ribosome-associated protein [Oscillatoria sp. FACHB-1407]
MQVALEITYRDVDKTPAIESLVQEKVAKLERLCNYINSCQIALEKIHDRPKHGSPYRVRIDITVPPNHELVADSNPGDRIQYAELDTVIRDAFSKVERQLKELTEKQRESEKTKGVAAQDTVALVTRLFPEAGYGFIKRIDDGEDIYFHRNSVLHDNFDRLEVGTGVRFEAEEGDKGLQATSVQIVNKPGVSVGKADEELIEPPLGWQER